MTATTPSGARCRCTRTPLYICHPSVITHHTEDLVKGEDVDKLVPDDTPKAVQVAVCGNDHPTLQELEEPPDPVRDEARRRIRLFEMKV